MRLRVDPWEPDYGASIEFDLDLEAPAGLTFDVEKEGDWAPIGVQAPTTLPSCVFVDGVRRIDLRLSAQEDDVVAPALAGSWAAGAASAAGRKAEVTETRMGRLVVAGGNLRPPELIPRIGATELTFTPGAVEGLGPLDPLRELQNTMRDAEAVLAQDLLTSNAADLVVVDGPLGYGMSGNAVGMIKRQSRVYLDTDHAAILPALRVGERTPIFRFGERRTERCSWYLRLATPRRIDGATAGIVRLERLPGTLDEVREMADLTAVLLPRLAPKPGWDPRAPQNLYPIAALESVLRHRLGDPVLIRRALETSINREIEDGR